MKKTLNIDDELFEEARAASGAATDAETVRLGIQVLVRRAAYERLQALRGTEPHAQDILPGAAKDQMQGARPPDGLN